MDRYICLCTRRDSLVSSDFIVMPGWMCVCNGRRLTVHFADGCLVCVCTYVGRYMANVFSISIYKRAHHVLLVVVRAQHQYIRLEKVRHHSIYSVCESTNIETREIGASHYTTHIGSYNNKWLYTGSI